ncbi:MAG: hypothetical protein U1E72_06820 [Burkholderiaceae bacterium]
MFNIISVVTFLLAVFFLVARPAPVDPFTGGIDQVAYAASRRRLECARWSRPCRSATPRCRASGSSRDVLIRLPLREGVKQSELVGRVFDALCKAEAVPSKRTGRQRQERSHRQAGLPGGECRAAGPAAQRVRRPAGRRGTGHRRLMALGFVVVGIMIYLAIRFEWKFAVAAIIATCTTWSSSLGFFAFFQWGFSLAVLAAVLAVHWAIR